MLDTLPATLATRARRVLAHERRAAVLVPFVADDGPLRLVLTRRTEDTPTHKGQVAFPGGGLSPGDADATAAALREAEEEIGLPSGVVEVLGWLDDFPTLQWASVVTPVVGRIRVLPALSPDPREVARIFEIPVASLQEPERWTTQLVERHGVVWPIYYFPWEGELLWGLSAYITMHLLALLPGGSPHPVPQIPADAPRLSPLAKPEGTP